MNEETEEFKELRVKYVKTLHQWKLNEDIATDTLCTSPTRRRMAMQAKRAAGKRLAKLRKQFEEKGWTVPQVKRPRPLYR